MNNCTFIGNLGRDPEQKYTSNNDPICNFSIAVSEKVKGEEKTMWVRCTAFGKLAEICGRYLTKGSKVYVAGKLNVRDYQDNAGATKTSIDLMIREMEMLGGNSGQPGASNGKQDRHNSDKSNGYQPQDDPAIPF